MKSLSMRKMEKNFIAVIEKNYSRKPYEEYTILDLYGFIQREMNELHFAVLEDSPEKIQQEIADVSNCLDYLYEALMEVNDE